MLIATLAAPRRCWTVGRFQRVFTWLRIRLSLPRSRLILHRVSAADFSELVLVHDVRIVSSHYLRIEPQIISSDKPKAPRRVGVGSEFGQACIASSLMTELCMIFGDSQMPNTALEPTATALSFYGLRQIHACGYSRRGSALDR
jgi:hypothetical protein